jgi:glutamyl/glutaminyl-tRNA synthetase
MEYPRLGYVPEGIVNFLALLGWSAGSDEEIFTRDDLVRRFALDGISGGNAVFNPEKLDWFNQQHIGRLPTGELADRLTPWLRDAGLWRDTFTSSEREWLLRVLELLKPRAKRLGQLMEDGRLFFADEVSYDPGAVTKFLEPPGVGEHLRAVADAFARVEPYAAGALERALRELAAERGVKPAALIHATRVAVTGKSVSPGLFEVLELLGRDRTAHRIAVAAAMAGAEG